MASPRGFANHHCYCARVLLDAWSGAEQEAAVARRVLNDAYGAGVQLHLLRAYGWFLAELGQLKGAMEPIVDCAALRALADAVWRAELTELEGLEQRPDSWLADLRAMRAGGADAAYAAGMLARGAGAGAAGFDRVTLSGALEQLAALMSRMSLSLDEW